MFRCVEGTVCLGVWEGQYVSLNSLKLFMKKFVKFFSQRYPPPSLFLSVSLCHYISIGKTTDYFRLRKSYKTPKHDVRSTEKCREFERRSRSYALKA
jgi:hypothetical protein